jgi:hypothetical protein
MDLMVETPTTEIIGEEAQPTRDDFLRQAAGIAEAELFVKLASKSPRVECAPTRRIFKFVDAYSSFVDSIISLI